MTTDEFITSFVDFLCTPVALLIFFGTIFLFFLIFDVK